MSSEWSDTRLRDLVSIKHGFAFKGEFFVDEETLLQLTTPGNFAIGGGFQCGKGKYYAGPVPSDYVLRAGDLIVTMTDLSKAADTLGYAAVVPNGTGKTWLHNQRVGLVRPQEGVNVHMGYIHYLMRSPDYRRWVVSTATGSTVKHTSPDRILSYEFLLPSLAEQREIGESLAILDDRITLLRETNATLEAIAQALFKSWFVDFDPVRAKAEGRQPEGMDAATAALFPDSFEESELGLVPRGWGVDSLAAIMDIAGGTQPPASEFIDEPKEGYIRLIQIRDYETDSHLTFVRDTKKLRTTAPEDIMVARYGASVGRICWGLEGAYNVALVRVVCEPQKREFLRTYLSSQGFQSRLAAVSGRSAQAGFNKGDIASFKIVAPNDRLYSAYQDLTWSLRDNILQNRDREKTLSQLRDTLLPRLISGQLRLPDAKSQVQEALS